LFLIILIKNTLCIKKIKYICPNNKKTNMAKNIEFSAEEMSELHAFYSMEMEKAELRLKAIKSIIAKIGSAPQKRGPKPSSSKQLNNEVNSELVELNKTKVAGRKPGRPAKVKTNNVESKILKRRGRPAKVKSEIVTLESTSTAEVISVPKKRGPKPGAKYKKTAATKTRVSKTPKVKLSKVETKKPVAAESSTAKINAQDSPKKRGPKPGSKYKKSAAKKAGVSKKTKLALPKTVISKPVSVETSEANATANNSSKKRGPKPGAKYTKRSVVAKPISETKPNTTVANKEKSVAIKTKRVKTPKAAKQVIAAKTSDVVADVVESKPTSINNEIKALKLSVAKLNKPKEVKVAKGAKVVVKKPAKSKAVKVNSSVKKSPVVKVKSPAKVVAKVESTEPQA
jgi:hypothetical protein